MADEDVMLCQQREIERLREVQPMFGDDDSLLSFLEAAGKGCISGYVTEWPQLRSACRWAFQQIKASRSAIALPIPAVELLKAVDALTVEQADELSEWAEQQVRIDEKMPQDMHRKAFQARFRRFAAAAQIAREYLRATAKRDSTEGRGASG